jgi:26S proteasome regulatory subunit N11
MLSLSTAYAKWLRDEANQTAEQRAIANVGKQEPKRHLADALDSLLADNIDQTLGTMLDTVAF